MIGAVSGPHEPSADSADPMVGQLVDGRFKVEGLLGAGAVGSVYRARDNVDDRKVALKVWNTAAYDEQTRGRFMREAKALSTLRHPNIVDIQTFGMSDALPYMAMEYLDGQSLEALLASSDPPEPLELKAAFDIMTQVLQALAYAHNLGVVHRDLKPDNVVLVGGEGGRRTVKLLDYGLAKFLSPSDDPVSGAMLTLTGMVMGTPLYMAPEQVKGKTVDVRVDVYAAGCMLFEMLSGRPPFTGDSHAEIYRAHLEAAVPRLPYFGREHLAVPGLQPLLERALAKRPEARFAHAGHMLDALLEVERGSRASQGMRVSKLGGAIAPLGDGAIAPGAGDAAAAQPTPARARTGRAPWIAALVTFLCTAALLAYALLR